jgi:DNA-binding transcriptional LysR family regulator
MPTASRVSPSIGASLSGAIGARDVPTDARRSSSAVAAASFLPRAVQRFRKEYPGLDIILRIQRSDILEKGLLDGEIDVAILGLAPRSPLLVGKRYREEEVVVIAPPKHPLVKKRFVPLKLLAKESLITEEKGGLIRDMVEQKFTERSLSFSAALEVDSRCSRDAIRRAVVSGLGVGFISKPHVEADIEAGRLKILRVPELKIKRTMYIAVHKGREVAPFVRPFLDFMRHNKEQL